VKEEFLKEKPNSTDSSFCLQFGCFACQNDKWLKRTRRGIFQGLGTSPQLPGFNLEPVNVGFVVNKETMYQVYDMIYLLTAVGFSPGGSTHLHTNNT
jgi:hypothetical protein